MKTSARRWTTAVLLALAAATAAAQAPPADAQAAAKAKAATVVDRLEAGEFDALAADFNDDMREAVTVDQLREGWTGLTAQAGALQSRGEPVHARQQGLDVVVTPLRFERGVVNAVVGFDSGLRIAGLMLQPAQPAPQSAPAQPAQAQPEPQPAPTR